MGQRDTLGWTRRSRGVHDTAKVFGFWWNRVDSVLLAQLPQILETHDVKIVKVFLDVVQILLLGLLVGVVNDIFDRLDILQDVVERLNQNRVEEDGDTFGLDERMLQPFFSEGIVSGDNGNRLRCSACSWLANQSNNILTLDRVHKP